MDILSKSNDTMELYYIPYSISCISNKHIRTWYFYNSEQKLSRLRLSEHLIKTDFDDYTWNYSIYNDKSKSFHDIQINLHKLLEKEMSFLRLMSINTKSISNLTEQISQFLGKYTFYNSFEFGWNYKCEKMHLKITIDSYKSSSDKNIKLEIIDSNSNANDSNTWKKSYVNDKQLIKFLTNNNKFLIKVINNKNDQTLPIKQLENLNISENTIEPELDWHTFKDNSNLFIQLPLEKRIMIQSCLDPRENIEEYFGLNNNNS